MRRTGRNGKSCAAAYSNGASVATSVNASSPKLRRVRAIIALSMPRISHALCRRRVSVTAQARHQPAMPFDAVVDAEGAERFPVVGVGSRHDRNAAFPLNEGRCIGTRPLIARDVDTVSQWCRI